MKRIERTTRALALVAAGAALLASVGASAQQPLKIGFVYVLSLIHI